MNAFSRQGKALPSEVRNQIIEKLLSGKRVQQIYRDNQIYRTVGLKYRNIMQILATNYYLQIKILLTVVYGRFDCRDIYAVPSLLNHFSII